MLQLLLCLNRESLHELLRALDYNFFRNVNYGRLTISLYGRNHFIDSFPRYSPRIAT